MLQSGGCSPSGVLGACAFGANALIVLPDACRRGAAGDGSANASSKRPTRFWTSGISSVPAFCERPPHLRRRHRSGRGPGGQHQPRLAPLRAPWRWRRRPRQPASQRRQHKQTSPRRLRLRQQPQLRHARLVAAPVRRALPRPRNHPRAREVAGPLSSLRLRRSPRRLRSQRRFRGSPGSEAPRATPALPRIGRPRRAALPPGWAAKQRCAALCQDCTGCRSAPGPSVPAPRGALQRGRALGELWMQQYSGRRIEAVALPCVDVATCDAGFI